MERAKALMTIGTVVAITALAVSDAAGAYGSIPERNIFDLGSPVVPIVTPVARPSAKIELIGITTLFLRPWVCLKIETVEMPRPSSAAKYVLLAEGESAERVTVVSVNEREHCVAVRFEGRVQQLAFPENKNVQR